jgi:hypothetical protein
MATVPNGIYSIITDKHNKLAILARHLKAVIPNWRFQSVPTNFVLYIIFSMLSINVATTRGFERFFFSKESETSIN